MPRDKIDILHEMEQYRDAIKTKNTVIASVIKKKIINYVSDLEDENDPDALVAVHMSATADSNEEIRKLKAELEESRKNEAVCHCGALFSEHTQSDNHSAVGMKHPCPNEEKLREFGTHLSPCNFGEWAGVCKYGNDDCPALSESWSWIGNAINRYSELVSSLSDLSEHSEESLHNLCYDLIRKDKQWRDRYVGTLMMLAFDGSISDSRARELAEMGINKWRDTFKIMMKEANK